VYLLAFKIGISLSFKNALIISHAHKSVDLLIQVPLI